MFGVTDSITGTVFGSLGLGISSPPLHAVDVGGQTVIVDSRLAYEGAQHMTPVIDYGGMMNAWPYAQQEVRAPTRIDAPLFARDWLFWGWLAAMAAGCALRWAW